MALWSPMLNGNPSPESHFVGDTDFNEHLLFDDGTGLQPSDPNFNAAESVAAAKLATLEGKADGMAVVGSGSNIFQPASGTHTYSR